MTKTRLKEVIREEIAAVDFGQEFESSLISDLILQKHYHCAAQRLRPVSLYIQPAGRPINTSIKGIATTG